MIGGGRNPDYLSADVAPVPVSVSHHVMSHYCMDVQDQTTPRTGSLSLRFDRTATDYADLKPLQLSRNYTGKRSNNQDRDKDAGHLENNGSTSITPSSFLNPKEITVEQEQFAEQLTKTIDKIKSEREGQLADEMHLRHHTQSNNSPIYPSTERPTSPTPASPRLQSVRIKLSVSETGGVVVSDEAGRRSMVLADVHSMHNPFSSTSDFRLCSHPAVAAVLHNLRTQDSSGSPPSTTGDSVSPVSPSLENPTHGNRYPSARYPSLTLPPLRTDVENAASDDAGGTDRYTPVALTDMLVGPEDAVPPSSIGNMSTLSDLTVAVSGQVIVNPTTDGFLHLFHNSAEQNSLLEADDSRGDGSLNPRHHLTSLMTSYESENHPQSRQQPLAYSTAAIQNSYSEQQQERDCLLLGRKRNTSTTTPSMLSSATSAAAAVAMKRGRRRHEPTIAAAQALINATTNSVGQLSYAPNDVATMASLKMEDRPPHQHAPVMARRVSVAPATSLPQTPMSMGGYDQHTSMGQSDTSLTALDDEMCSDPSMLKIEKKRARNRLAARRCRERKVTRIATLEGEVDLLKAYIERLRSDLDSSQKETNQLRLYLEHLVDSYPALGEKLKTLSPVSSQTSTINSFHPPLPLSE